MIGAIGGGLLLVMLCVWGANKLFFQENGKATAKTASHNPEKAASAAAIKTEETQPAEFTPSAFPPAFPAVPAATTRPSTARILFCVPHNGIWEPDYFNVVDNLPSGVAVTVAST